MQVNNSRPFAVLPHFKLKPQKFPVEKKVNAWKSKDRTFLQNCIYCFVEYSNATTIHGFRYLTESGRSIIERICWLIAIVTSLCGCIYLILSTYQKWVGSPVVVTFANSETSVSDIPFPAVTICPEIKSNKSVFNYTDIYLKKILEQPIPDNEMQYFDYMSLICQTPTQLLNNNATTIEQEALDYILKVGPHFEDYAYEIKWMDYNIIDEVKLSFTPVFTSEGLCYTFNLVDREELFTDIAKFTGNLFSTNNKISNWFPDTGYADNAATNAYPFKTSTAGIGGGLVFVLSFVKDQFDYLCGNALQGYKIALHQPAEFPLLKENYIRISPDRSVVVAIKPNMMTTSADVTGYSSEDRKCYFTSEKDLKFFRIYTQQNCLVECLTNFSFSMCGCVSFYMPMAGFYSFGFIIGEKSTPICAASSKECLAEANRVGYGDGCDCLPACYSIKFNVETSDTDMHLKEQHFVRFKAGEVNEETYMAYVRENRIYAAQVSLFFKDMLFVRSERKRLHGYTDFWASVGGIMGLFIGFSILSMCEIIYYATLRIFYNVKMYGRRYWAGNPKRNE